jgi:hypothetical protein
MISCTAFLGDSPVLMRRARDSRSVRRPPRAWIELSSSERAFSLPSPESSSLMCFRTKRFADSGAASPRRIERKTRSGRDLESDLEKVVSLVRKITWATFAETRRAALQVLVCL